MVLQFSNYLDFFSYLCVCFFIKEWVEEQKKKDGVMIVHRGTQRTKFGTSTYQGAIVTIMDGKDVRYENADISLRLNGKEYRMTGDVVERKDGIWYVDGSIVDMPEQEQAPHMAEDIKEMEEKVEEKVDDAVNSFLNAFGITNINCNQTGSKHKSSSRSFNIKNDYTGGETIIHGAGTRTITTGKRTVIKGGSVNIRRGDRTYTIKGETIEKIDGRWYADGKAVDWDSIGGEYTESNVISIEINGDGDFEAPHVDCAKLNIIINGDGDVVAKKFNCEDVTIQIDGNGDISTDLKANNINLQLTSDGEANLDVKCDNLIVSAGGSGDVKLKGKCHNLTKQSFGKASLDSRRLQVTGNIKIQ